MQHQESNADTVMKSNVTAIVQLDKEWKEPDDMMPVAKLI